MVCKPNPCKNGGICNGEDGSCHCIGDFTGKLCETAIEETTEAPTSDPAKTAAEQTAKSESRTETADASLVCYPNPCKNGGICKDGRCYCIGGFIGRLCEKTLQLRSMVCKPNPCKNGGICNGEDGSCYCIGGFIGRLCETVKEDSTVAPTSDHAKTAAEQTAKSESTTETADASMVCKPNPCKNKGICNGEDGSCHCIGDF